VQIWKLQKNTAQTGFNNKKYGNINVVSAVYFINYGLVQIYSAITISEMDSTVKQERNLKFINDSLPAGFLTLSLSFYSRQSLYVQIIFKRAE
jgi:hypothetical protein